MTSKYARRHYEDVAEVLRVHTPHVSDGVDALTRHHALIGEFADMFARDNGRFDRGRFMAACAPTVRA